MDHIGDRMSIKYKSHTKSLITGEETVQIIDLGSHGFADSFFPERKRDLAIQSAPLVCMLDQVTGLVQMRSLTDAGQRYQGLEYSYTSSNSETAKKHWTEFISYANSFKEIRAGTILEIGSNDGYLLSLAKSLTTKVLGVDASPYMADIAKSSGIPTCIGSFGESQKLKSEILSNYSSFDFIFANNVLNHSNDPVNFVKQVAELLGKDGIFIFEVPYWLESITSLHFDQIYHEHVTYLTAKSAIALLATAGLYIQDISVVDYHGGSLRVVASMNSKRDCPMTAILLAREDEERLSTPERYADYMNDISKKRDAFVMQVMEKKSEGKVIFGIGAAAKANTLLTYYGFTTEIMDFVLDTSLHKQGKLTPVTRIPIVGDDAVIEMQNGIGIVLAWNLSAPIQKKLLLLNKELEFLNI